MDRQTERVKTSEVCQFNNKKLLEEYFFQERIEKLSSKRSHAAWTKFMPGGLRGARFVNAIQKT